MPQIATFDITDYPLPAHAFTPKFNDLFTMTDLFGIEVAPVKSKLRKPKKQIVKRLKQEAKKRSGPVYAEVCKILPHYSVIYAREISGFFSGREKVMPVDNKPKGAISDKGAIRLGSALNWIILFSPWKTVYSKKEKKSFCFKINFITLTLPTPQAHDDHYIKQHLLAPFLKWLERSWHVYSYVWKAEAQSNGNIHFHITTNQFVHWKSIRGKWNRLLAKHGYCKVFQDGTNDKGDAATNIKSVKTMKGIVSYLKGYICKKDVFKKRLSVYCLFNSGIMTKKAYRQITCINGNVGITKEYKRPIEGKLWSTSHNLSKISCFIDMEHDPDYFEARNALHIGHTEIYSDKFIRILSHKDFDKRTNHPLITTKLKDVWNTHFSAEVVQTEIEIESFY